jgi:threonine/homoserine/homoserine lactone efflux protein
MYRLKKIVCQDNLLQPGVNKENFSLDQVAELILTVFLKGLILGFSIAAPIGPMGLICIRRTLAQGRLNGLVTGLGVATADAFYGSVAGFGLTFIANFLIHQQIWVRIVGGLFLCYLGVKAILSKPVKSDNSEQGRSLAGAYFSMLFFTLTNPLTILTFAAMFAGLGLTSAGGNYGRAALLVAGVFCGSAFWWLILSSLVNMLRAKFNYQRMIWVNRISGFLIVGFGLAIMLSLKK